MAGTMTPDPIGQGVEYRTNAHISADRDFSSCSVPAMLLTFGPGPINLVSCMVTCESGISKLIQPHRSCSMHIMLIAVIPQVYIYLDLARRQVNPLPPHSLSSLGSTDKRLNPGAKASRPLAALQCGRLGALISSMFRRSLRGPRWSSMCA